MIQLGDVYLVLNDEITPAKQKLSVCVCVAPELFFLINSENRKIYDCVLASKKDNACLKYDSYVSCSRTFAYPSKRLNKKLGRLSPSTLAAIREKVKSSEILEQKVIDAIIRGFEKV